MITGVRTFDRESMAKLAAEQPQLLAENCAVSMSDHTMQPVLASSPRCLAIQFSDVNLYDLMRMKEKERQCIKLFSERDADRIIDFLYEQHARPGAETLYVNCFAGISRSGAIACFTRQIFGLDEAAFARDNPRIAPNMLILGQLRKRWAERIAMPVGQKVLASGARPTV
jgi:predicted protein tyrosine phosphatase